MVGLKTGQGGRHAHICILLRRACRNQDHGYPPRTCDIGAQYRVRQSYRLAVYKSGPLKMYPITNC